jgi:esterase/lipase superfamily enzyme
LYAREVHDTAVKEVQAVLLQAPDIQIDDVGVKFAESAKLRPPIVMMPPPDSAILIGSLELTTGAAHIAAARETRMRAKDGSAENHRK